LIVVGTYGRTGLSRLVLGSVAEKVARQAKCAVLTVKDHPLVVKATAKDIAARGAPTESSLSISAIQNSGRYGARAALNSQLAQSSAF
jgi:hypothetical protein